MERPSILETDMVPRHAGWCLLVVGLSIVVPGCGKKGPVLVPVTGLVTLDGEPLPSAVVAFEQSDGLNMATGVTNDQGRYELETHKVGKGARPGMHRVQICCSQSEAPGKTVYLAPKHYCTFDTSGLTAEVGEKRTTLTFDLSSRKDPPNGRPRTDR